MDEAPSPLAGKLLIKPGSRVALLNAPDGYPERLRPLPGGARLVELASGGDLDAVQVFVHDAAELRRLGPEAIAAVKPDGLLWVCYPKGGRKAGTDLSRDVLWEALGGMGMVGVTLVAVDETWSAMRCRPPDRVGR